VAVCAQLEEPLRIACAGGGSKCTISPCLEDLVQVGRQRCCPEGLRIMKAGVTLKGALAQAKLRLVDVGQLRQHSTILDSLVAVIAVRGTPPCIIIERRR
jgi:hypothetical protein